MIFAWTSFGRAHGIIGVSHKAVQAWEAGTNQPTGPAARMIDMLERKPEEVVSMYLKRA